MESRTQQDGEFKSKNLEAERKRRRKLSERLLTLRSLVPIITNMNKATIIEDSITYIQELQKTSDALTDELVELNTNHGPIGSVKEEAEAEEPLPADDQDFQSYDQLKEEVEVSSIVGGKLLIKIICKSGGGRFTKLIQGMTCLGLEMSEICATSFNGGMLVSACVQGTCDDTIAVQLQQTKQFLSEMVRNM